MRIIKVILSGAIILFVINKYCGLDIPLVTREALETSQNETRDAKESLRSVQENYARQNRELSSILAELSELSLQATALQINPESGSRQLTLAEQIDSNLDAIRVRIDRLEKEAERARNLDKDMALSVQTIRRLRSTVANQKKEIENLRNIISDKDATINRQNTVIAVQKDTISEQIQTILRQKTELKHSLDQQTEMVFKAGCEFERLGDESDVALSVSGRKDKEKVRQYKKAIYEKANQFFQQAASKDHAEAKGRCEVIAYKIYSL